MTSLLIRNARIVGPRKVLDGDILIQDGRIAKIGRVRAPAGAKAVSASGLYALPGFVDLHTHGGLGFDAVAGEYDPKTSRFRASDEIYRKRLPLLLRRFARTGVTRTLLGTFAAPARTLEAALRRLADYQESESNGLDGARLEGMNIEGTFLMRKQYAGAQNPADFHSPNRRFFDRLNRAARGHIRYVNVAPEFGKASETLTRYLAARGVLVGAGHCSCDADQVNRCANAGLRVAVHFLNGPTGASFKPFHGGNVLEAFLSNDDLCAEQICDGWHIAPAYVREVIRRKGLDRVVAVTDCCFPAGARGIRQFRLGGVAGVVHPSGQYLQVKGTAETLFGSVLTMSVAFGNILSWLTRDMPGVWTRRHPAMSLDDALVGVTKCCSTNAARLLGMDGPDGLGALEAGRCADIVLARLNGKAGHWKLDAKLTFVAGRQIL